jgi:large subunit ribosomal protein L13
VKTYALKADDVRREWWVVDAAGQPLGRLATQIVKLLRGKHKPAFATHLDNGDFVIVVNAGKIKVSSTRLKEKNYYSYSLYPGGLRTVNIKDMLVKHPERVIAAAVKGMMPKNRMTHHIMTKLKVYQAAEHPHAAQKPKIWKVEA